MKFCLIVTILSCLITLTVQQQHPDILECKLDNRTRTFDTLEHYQGTNISFDPKHIGYLGNNVNFSFVSIDRLFKNSLISFGSNSIMKISLKGKSIVTVDEGAFLQLFCLHDLDLSYNSIGMLSRGVFEGLPNLIRLNLAANRLKHVPYLRDLSSLEYLDLSRNQIEDAASFSLPMNLISLNLSHNQMKFIKNDTLNNLSSLKILELSYNKFSEIDPSSWDELYFLEDFNLAGNSLKFFNISHFPILSHLKKLNLSRNHLTTLQMWGIKKLAKLELLDITQNDWYCEDLEMIKHYLLGSKIILQQPINCSAVQTTASPVVSTTKKEPEDILKIIAQNEKILASNEKLEDHVSRVANVLINLFVIVVLYIIVNVAIKIGLFRNLYLRFWERNRGYLDNSDSEAAILMR